MPRLTFIYQRNHNLPFAHIRRKSKSKKNSFADESYCFAGLFHCRVNPLSFQRSVDEQKKRKNNFNLVDVKIEDMYDFMCDARPGSLFRSYLTSFLTRYFSNTIELFRNGTECEYIFFVLFLQLQHRVCRCN